MSTRLNLWKPEPKRRSGIVRMPPVVPGVPLSRYTNTELGVRIARKAGQPRQDPGVAWARLMNSANRPEKDAARFDVLRLLTKQQFPRLSILTFPASDWRFEHALLAMREPADYHGEPQATRIISVERDIAIYRAACHNIPRRAKLGTHGGTSGLRIREIEPPSFATASVSTSRVSRFICCTFEDYANRQLGDDNIGRRVLDAAWLDFNGQLSQPRLEAIERFWNRQLGSLLIVTLLELHLSDWMRARIQHHGGVEHLLNTRLEGSRLESATRYGDGAPMVQIVLRRDFGIPRLNSLVPLSPSRRVSAPGGAR